MAYISQFTASDGVTYNLKDKEAQNYKVSKKTDHEISGTPGWYKFFEQSSSSGAYSKKFIFLIQEVYGYNRSAIVSFYSYRMANGSWSTSRLSIISSSIVSSSDIAMHYDGNIIALYCRKYSSDDHPLTVIVISGCSGTGDYADPSSFFVSTAVESLPSGAIYANPCSDGNGNIISSTYQKIPVRGTISLALNWSGTGPYTQTVTVTGATVTANSIISLLPTSSQLASLMADGVSAMSVENNDGELTVHVLGAAPTVAMVIDCKVEESQ